MPDIQTTFISAEFGYDEFDVSGLQCVERVCVPHDIKCGNIFNVRCSEGGTVGAVWEGSLERSLTKFAETRDYQEIVASAEHTTAARPGL